MSIDPQTPDIGRIGVWRRVAGLTPEFARAVERLGYGTLWIGISPPADLAVAEQMLDATTTLTVATGITNIWSSPAAEVAESFHRLEDRHPGRFLLGVGAGHRESSAEVYAKPYQAVVAYLDELDAAGVPAGRRVLAALGPKMLRLAADRAAGAHPYLTTPEHTREARELLGPAPLLAAEHKVVLDPDPVAARVAGRPLVTPYLNRRNYLANLARLGFTADELADGGSDRVIDALVAHGDAPSIAARLTEHLDAGANHVAVQVLPYDRDEVPALAALAESPALRG
ncbi:LLM class F420-dependent oxidoreductase [Rhodococcus tukisamuensis]|uniref:Probable F420-dependent oxidoreductase, MSMEG_4141 family n=1 Tax=Rhodococcus tukisamuensis TaxID=168276 RepID=A0A1G7CJV4_9NOCA|nr:LLM class F420-dependent oxidoreductase [Rhodococcus tukisamuensis]SDE39521.1 probable F420-dependent oxidoreductase, MSMEG_4141 family [Rhodococcus tukisamuensis]